MATIEQMALAQSVLELGMRISRQGKFHISVFYYGSTDQLGVLGWEFGTSVAIKGWEPSSHTVYLGTDPCTGLDPMQELQSLWKQLDALLEKDADGVPV
jgi:hypothetical protein